MRQRCQSWCDWVCEINASFLCWWWFVFITNRIDAPKQSTSMVGDQSRNVLMEFTLACNRLCVLLGNIKSIKSTPNARRTVSLHHCWTQQVFSPWPKNWCSMRRGDRSEIVSPSQSQDTTVDWNLFQGCWIRLHSGKVTPLRRKRICSEKLHLKNSSSIRDPCKVPELFESWIRRYVRTRAGYLHEHEQCDFFNRSPSRISRNTFVDAYLHWPHSICSSSSSWTWTWTYRRHRRWLWSRRARSRCVGLPIG